MLDFRAAILHSRYLRSLSSVPPQPSLPVSTHPKPKQAAPKGEGGVAHKDRPHAPTRNLWRLKQQRYSKHIGNLVRKNRQEEAVQVLEQMKRSRVRPDVVVYNTILSGYAKQGNIKMAFRTFNEVIKILD